MIEANKFYFLYDREDFIRTTGVNEYMVPILDKLGPLKMKKTEGDTVYNVFETSDGRIMTGDQIAKEYDFKWSFHITEREARLFKEVPGLSPVKTIFPNLLAIPEIRLTITTMEEVNAAIIMLQGIKDASV